MGTFVIRLVGLALLAAALDAHSGALYVETGVGVTQIRGGKALYGASAPESPNLGPALNSTFAWNLAWKDSLLQPHIGLRQRYSSSSSNGHYLSLLTLSPMLRLESHRFYFSGGLGPLVWKRNGKDDGFDNLGRASGMSYFADFGLIWRMVPFFHVALEGSAEAVNGSAGLSPRPVLGLSIVFRFVWTSTEGNNRRGGQWDGWRYPFGIEIR